MVGLWSLLLLRAVIVHLNLPSGDFMSPMKQNSFPFHDFMPFPKSLAFFRADVMSFSSPETEIPCHNKGSTCCEVFTNKC